MAQENTLIPETINAAIRTAPDTSDASKTPVPIAQAPTTRETVLTPTTPNYPPGFIPPVPLPRLVDPDAIEHFLNEFAPNPVTRRHMERRLRETIEHYGGSAHG
jgi:hypothetical protein